MNNESNNNHEQKITQQPTAENTQQQNSSAAEPQNIAQNENLYAQKSDNQNAAFAQSQNFHRETPYGAEPQQQNEYRTASAGANPQEQGTIPGYNPYTGQPYGQAPQEAPKKAKKKGSFWKKAAAAVALALIFGVVSGAVILGMTGGRGTQSNHGGSSSVVTDGDGDTPMLNGSVSGQLQSASAAMQEALEKAAIAAQDTLTVPQINIIMEPAMVSINCIGETTVNYGSFFGSQTYQTASSGSGIIVGENETELLIVTNNHVIADTTEIAVQFVDESEATAYVKGTDEINDLAIIVVNLADIPAETMRTIAYAEIGDSDALVIGEDVVAIGNALGFGQSVTRGIVSALNRAVTDSNGNTTYLIQTDAAINPGNSGGALVNMKGQVIGINSAKYSDEAVEGMCFAIPVNTAMPILEELMTRTTRVEVTDPEKAAYLGISLGNDVTSAIAAAYNMPVGAYVTEVVEGGPAGLAGMYAGDIITRFDHDTITGYNDLLSALSYYEAGETVDVVVQRADRGQYTEVTLTVTLGVKPADTNTANGEQSQQDRDRQQQEEEENSYPSWYDYFGW